MRHALIIAATMFVSMAAHAGQLDDIQDELDTQSFEADMDHDEVMDALAARNQPAPAPSYMPRTYPPFDTCVRQERYNHAAMVPAVGHCMLTMTKYGSWSVAQIMDGCDNLNVRYINVHTRPSPEAMRRACLATWRWAQAHHAEAHVDF